MHSNAIYSYLPQILFFFFKVSMSMTRPIRACVQVFLSELMSKYTSLNQSFLDKNEKLTIYHINIHGLTKKIYELFSFLTNVNLTFFTFRNTCKLM